METAILPPRKVLEALEHSTTKVLQELGPSVHEAVMFHLERIMNVPREKVFDDPSRFAATLEKVFSVGAPIVEEKIIRSMCDELHIGRVPESGTFLDKISRLIAMESPRRRFQLGALEQSMDHNQ